MEGLLRLGSFELHFEEGGEAISRQEAGCSRKHLMKKRGLQESWESAWLEGLCVRSPLPSLLEGAS